MFPRSLPVAGLIVLCSISCGTGSGVSAAPASITATPAWVTRGYKGAFATVTQPFAPSTRDANGNRIVSNGEIALAGVTSVAERFGAVAAGAQTYRSGAGAGSGTSAWAIGNLSQIQVSGSGNTIIATVNQTNVGQVTATTTATVSSK
jgi:holdfast attachment protein HfaA